jgi:hypothetical protein
VGPNIQKLLDIGSEVLAAEFTFLPPSFVETPLLKDVMVMLSRKNGFLAFESALHVFPCAKSTSCYTLAEWNEPNLWRVAYKNLAVDLLFFAQDVFGNQFGVWKSEIIRFDAETGDKESFALTLDEWAKRILTDYEVETGYPLAHQWQSIYGILRLDWRLLPKRPFVLGGGYEIANLITKPSVLGMRLRGSLATQLHDLPDGTQIEFRITE